MKEPDTLLDTWTETDSGTRKAFAQIVDHLDHMDHITLEFVARPGISYSLRPRHEKQTDQTLFAMVDVIDDDPNERWLSVCFYSEMISDPDEMGDLIPEGLLGEDGYCFDLDAYDEDDVDYLKQRLTEAFEYAGR